MAMSRTSRLLAWIGVPLVALGVLVAVWDWDWLIPIVDGRAGAAIGRDVKITHLHVKLFPIVQVEADGVTIANPKDWPAGDPPLATAQRLILQVDVLGYIKGHGLTIPLIALDQPKIYAAETADGKANFRLSTGGGSGGGTSVKIGNLQINDGDIHAVVPKLKADFEAKVATQGEGDEAKIVADAKGTYAAQPITAHLVGGALLSLRDHDHPWPIDLALANGPTKLTMKGTLQDPTAFKGANVVVRIAGPDMARLEPLVGFPIPKTPAYQISGHLGLEGIKQISLRDFRGRLGNSDIEGTILEKPGDTEANGKPIPDVTLDLRSNRVDLADLSGFIGGAPGRTNEANATPQQREEAKKAAQSPHLLPDKPIHVPSFHWADIHLRYRGAHIEGKNIPLDDLAVTMDVVGGRIQLHPISFGVGKGRLSGNIDLTPESDRNVRARMDVRMQNLDVSRLMAATHTFQGAGSVSGVGAIDATGNSLSSLLGNGNGEVKMAMAGGDLSALLVDLTGLQFGNALLSALGVPQKTPVQCFVTDLALKRGILDFQAMTLDTGEAITNVGGNLDLSKETIDLNLKTDAKHFSIGSLPTRIAIRGTFKSPAIRPGAEVAARAGAAAGLGVLFAPLAILPTIQFGTSEAEDRRCGELLQQARQTAGGKALPQPAQGASSAR